MNEDYLWDGSGDPDPEIQKLEAALGKFRHKGQPPSFPASAIADKARSGRGFFRFRWTFGLGLAAGAAIVFVVVVVGIVRRNELQHVPSAAGWSVERVAGTPLVETNRTRRNSASNKLAVGETLVTDGNSQATISVADVGTVNVEPNTTLRLVAGGKGRNQFSLERGTIHAFIWAAPGQFTVNTPSAIAVDLGCQYTLRVDDSGSGLLRTTLGWVGFKLNGHEAFIPAGAVCATRPKIGPGTPYFEDASASFREAVSKFDFAAGSPEERSTELETILSQSRQRDALSLWHLLARVEDADRGRVYDRIAALVPPPPGVTREGILRLDQNMLDLWWNELGLGDVALWRTWERTWSQNKT
ncbi:MAG: FecR family protein [Candidatus Acidiferrum sp.]